MLARIASRSVPVWRSFRALPGPRRASSKTRRGSAGSRHGLEMGSWAVPDLCLPGVGSPVADPTGQFRWDHRFGDTLDGECALRLSPYCRSEAGCFADSPGALRRHARASSAGTDASSDARPPRRRLRSRCGELPSSDLPTSGAEWDRILDRVWREIGSVASEQYLCSLTLETVGPPGRAARPLRGHGQYRGDVRPLGAGRVGP